MGWAASVHAQTVTYTLPDAGTFANYDNFNTGDKYTGTGFVGMHRFYFDTGFGVIDIPNYVHAFGFEQDSVTRTVLEVDVSELRENHIPIYNAFLSFDVLDSLDATAALHLTSFDATGTLGFNWDPISPLGSQDYTLGIGSNRLDVTTLLADRVASGADWFGLYLQGTSERAYTYTALLTSTETDEGTITETRLYPDRAKVRLIVNAPSVPEPGSLALFAPGLAAWGVALRRRKRKSPVLSDDSHLSASS
jgi:hypothetical protein